MNQNKLRWLWYLSAVITLCLTGVILYLFIVHSEISNLYSDILHSSDSFYAFAIAVCFLAAADAIAFAIGYSMLRKLRMLASLAFAVYFAVIVAGNTLIILLLSPMVSANFLRLIAPAFMFFVFFNFAISKIFLDEDIRDALLISMLISMVNIIMGIMFIPLCGYC